MKLFPALAAIELADIPTGVLATDALLKRSPVAFVRSGSITQGRYLVLFGGSTAAVEEAMDAALQRGGDAVLDSVLLPDVHGELYAAIVGSRQVGGEGSLAVLETDRVCPTLRVAELVLKNTGVHLVEVRLADAGLAGKGVSLFRGELHDVEAAVEVARAALERRGVTLRAQIVSAPHDALAQQVEAGTSFSTARLLELEGEEV